MINKAIDKLVTYTAKIHLIITLEDGTPVCVRL